MKDNRDQKPDYRNQRIFFYLVTGYWLLVTISLSGCAPTFPKERIEGSISELCQKEYKISVKSRIAGNTIAIYLPVENLFDAVLNIEAKASKKINDVILSISRVTLSTDAKFDFYVVIAQDPRVPEIEIVYIRYVNDVKRFLLGDISRDEYAKRAVIMLKTPPQAEREKVFKELFAKLNIENADEMIKEYLEGDGGVTGIGDISYWNNRFFIKEIHITEFLATQIAERIKMTFRQDKELNKLYELKGADGKYSDGEGVNDFIFNVNIANRVEPLLLDSGLELDAYKKKQLVFKKLVGVIGKVLWAYSNKDFDSVEISIPAQKIRISRDELWEIKKGRGEIEGLF